MRKQAGFLTMELEDVPVELNKILDIIEDAYYEKYISLDKFVKSHILFDVIENIQDAQEHIKKAIIEKNRTKRAFFQKLVDKALLWNDVRKLNADIKLMQKTLEDIKEIIYFIKSSQILNADKTYLSQALKSLILASKILNIFINGLIKFKGTI